MSYAPRFAISNAIADALTRIERARGFLDAAKLSKDWLSRMQARALVLEAHHTTHIEGTQLTLDQAERLWAGKKVAGARPDDARELLNYREAFSSCHATLAVGSPSPSSSSGRSTGALCKAYGETPRRPASTASSRTTS
jgi:Fic family protein